MPDQPVDAIPPRPSLVTLTHVIYALHAFSVLTGLATSATVVGTFVFGTPSIVAVVLNYMYRSGARGSFLESHFRWQIRTFWYGALWLLVVFLLIVSVIGILAAPAVLLGVGIWVVFRIGRGWVALVDQRGIDD